jgi:hypothetical protein
MKAFNIIIKILAALAAIAGVVYVAATYGDRIIARLKKLVNRYTKRYAFEDMDDFELDDDDFEN